MAEENGARVQITQNIYALAMSPAEALREAEAAAERAVLFGVYD